MCLKPSCTVVTAQIANQAVQLELELRLTINWLDHIHIKGCALAAVAELSSSMSAPDKL